VKCQIGQLEVLTWNLEPEPKTRNLKLGTWNFSPFTYHFSLLLTALPSPVRSTTSTNSRLRFKTSRATCPLTIFLMARENYEGSRPVSVVSIYWKRLSTE